MATVTVRREGLRDATFRRAVGLSKPCIFWCAGVWHVQPAPAFFSAMASDSQRGFAAFIHERNVAAQKWVSRWFVT